MGILFFIIAIYVIVDFTLDVASGIKDAIIFIVDYIRKQKRKKR